MESSVRENVFHIVGVSMIIIFLLSLILNVFVLFIFSSIHKTKGNNITLSIINISIANILQACVYPLNTVTALSKDHYIGKKGCILEGFVVAWFAITAIALLACLGYERLQIAKVVEPTEPELTLCNTRRIASCWVYGFLWALAPLLGWSKYVPEGIGMNCSVDWQLRNSSGLSYTASIFICAFIFPVSVICYTYSSIWWIVKGRIKVPTTVTTGENGGYCINPASTRKQLNLAKTVFLMSVSFCTAWLPYAIVSLVAVIDPTLLSPIQATIPSIMAKTSTIYLPLIYGVRHSAFRKQCMKLFTRGKVTQAN